ncbi:unnamed protein product [Paramecium primaurelia]|uniref:Uncharacterized protein n=1 Tax=Paramecium primaurelia TaxID=5886 RepID=A0A8S1M1M3_PARPR|nr:unnamed protein product [Paramecium primaurelia]
MELDSDTMLQMTYVEKCQWNFLNLSFKSKFCQKDCFFDKYNVSYYLNWILYTSWYDISKFFFHLILNLSILKQDWKILNYQHIVKGFHIYKRPLCRDSQTNYQIEIWVGSIFQQVYHQYGAIRTQWDEWFYQSFKLYKIFVSKKFDVNKAKMLNSISELKFSTKILGNLNFDISTSLTHLKLISTRKCQQGKNQKWQLCLKMIVSSLLPI